MGFIYSVAELKEQTSGQGGLGNLHGLERCSRQLIALASFRIAAIKRAVIGLEDQLIIIDIT